METQREKKWWSSSCGRIELWMFQEQADSVHHTGQCDKDVAFLAHTSNIFYQTDRLDTDIVRQVLDEYGCWDEEELKDNVANVQRLLWIAGCDIAEEDEE
jgi:hypothetical protein